MVVTGATATVVHGIGELQPTPYTFAVASRRQSQRPEIRYRVRPLIAEEWSQVEGLPVTSVERTVRDLLADGADLSLVAHAFADAVTSAAIDPGRLQAQLAHVAHRLDVPRGDGAAAVGRLLELAGLDEEALLRRILNDPERRERARPIVGLDLVEMMQGLDLFNRRLQQQLQPIAEQLRLLVQAAAAAPRVTVPPETLQALIAAMEAATNGPRRIGAQARTLGLLAQETRTLDAVTAITGRRRQR